MLFLNDVNVVVVVVARGVGLLMQQLLDTLLAGCPSIDREYILKDVITRIVNI